MHSLRIAFSRNRLDSATFAGKNAFRRGNPQNSKEVKYTPTFSWFSAWVWGTKDLKPCFWSTASLYSHHPQLSPFTERTLVHRTMVWAFIYSLWISGCTYFNSLSSPLSPSGDFPTLNRTALEKESKVSSSPAPSPGTQWQADRMSCTAPSSRRFWAFFSSHNRKELDWQAPMAKELSRFQS